MRSIKKISLLTLGGLGIETKQIFSQNKNEKNCTVGGSGWHLALTGKALGCQSSIMASVGNDNLGQHLLSILDKHNINFQGIISEKTQEYSSIIKDGVPVSFSATLDNIPTEQVINCFDKKKPQYDILIVGYMSYDVLSFVLQERKKNLNALFVLDMSDSILSIPNDKIVEYLSEFDIVTMNTHEAETLANKLNVSVEQFLEMVNSKQNMLFVTSISSVKYIVNKQINTYKFTQLNNVIDTTGAGDAFAVGVAVGKHKKMSIDKILCQAIYSAHSMCGIAKKENISDFAWWQE